ncbi:MAG: hypothetical protein EOM68_24050 [Spirochaetia bacterium]|nr:hypothetical protein [Spirochaetia bacterium]
MKLKGMQMSLEIDAKDLENLMKQENFLTPLEAGFSAPYAEAIEYGTPPGTITPYKAIDAWAQRKLNMRNDKERSAFVAKVVASHYRRGRRPNAFFAPAINSVAMDITRYFSPQEGIYSIAQAIISTAQKNIEEKGITDMGGLIASAYVRRQDYEIAKSITEGL